MSHGDIVWCDLAHPAPQDAQALLGAVAGWRCDAITAPDGAPYLLAATEAGPVAGIFDPSQRFEGADLTPGWIPFIEVDDLTQCEAQVTELGGAVLIPMDTTDAPRMTLARDPQGAAFVMIEGAGLPPQPSAGPRGTPIWRSLWVSAPDAVTGFYATLFDWQITRGFGLRKTYRVATPDGRPLAEITSPPRKAKAHAPGWMMHLASPALGKARRAVKAAKGKVLQDAREEVPPHLLVTGASGPVLGLRESVSGPGLLTARWRTLLALAALVLAAGFSLPLALAVLFGLWIWRALETGEARLVEPIARDAEPGLYWTVIGVWVALGLLLLVRVVL